ncbi:hypothetical protein FOXYSP1_10615 [Fusarium oxysporum f. sp. phaseoli]
MRRRHLIWNAKKDPATTVHDALSWPPMIPKSQKERWSERAHGQASLVSAPQGEKIKMEFLQPFSFNFNPIITSPESYHIRILRHPRESNFLNPITHHRLRHLCSHLLGLDHPLSTLTR